MSAVESVTNFAEGASYTHDVAHYALILSDWLRADRRTKIPVNYTEEAQA